MPSTPTTPDDLTAEDILIEKQLKEAQERIAYLKAQVAKERKLRLQIKQKNNQGSISRSKEEDQMTHVQASLEQSLLTTNSTASVPESERPSTSTGTRSASSLDAGHRQEPSSNGSGSLGISKSQPSGIGRPSTSQPGRRRRSKQRNSLGKLKKSQRRPRTAGGGGLSPSAAQRTSLSRLSPSRSRPSEKHEMQAKNMSYQRLKDLLQDPLFQEAAKRKGCRDTQLHPRRMESFRRQENRAALLPIAVAQLNFEAYETTRVNLLAMVLHEFEVVMEEMRKEEEKIKLEQDKLAKVFVKQIGGEEVRIKAIVHNRHKIQNVSLAENRLLIARRKKFEQNASKGHSAQEKYLAKLKRDREHREAKGRRQQEKIAQVSGMKDSMLQARNKIMEQRFAARDARIAHKMQHKAMKIKQKQDLAASGKDDRTQRQEHSKKVRAMRMKRLNNRLKEKESHVKKVQIKKQQELLALRVRKTLRNQRRMENIERARREQEYRNKVVVKKLEMKRGSMDKMKEIEDAIRRERGLKKKKELIARHKWITETTLERGITPGPGEYHATNGDMANSHANCAKWGMQNPKSEIEWIMYRSKQVPAPGDYTPYDPSSAVVGGKLHSQVYVLHN